MPGTNIEHPHFQNSCQYFHYSCQNMPEFRNNSLPTTNDLNLNT